MDKKVIDLFKDRQQETDAIKIIDDVNATFDEVSLDCFGTDWYELTKEQLQALIDGKVLLIKENDGEYQMFLKKK